MPDHTDVTSPDSEDLLAIAWYADRLSDPATATEWIWRWDGALYEHRIIDHTYSGLSLRNVNRLVTTCTHDLQLVPDADLGTVRAMATFLSRAERFCDGWLEKAASSGLAAALSQRLGVIARPNE